MVDTLLAIVACVSLKGQTNKQKFFGHFLPVSYLGNLTLSLLRVKTPAEDINNDMEKGEMVIGDRKLTVDDEKRIKTDYFKMVALCQ